MNVPSPRGPLSHHVATSLLTATTSSTPPRRPSETDPLTDDDLQIALFMLYELHYQGFDDVPADMEWEPRLIELRNQLEDVFLAALTQQVPMPSVPTLEGLAEFLFEMAATADGPDLSGYVARTASLQQIRELVIHRSAYHLKEADPYTWVIPRITGAAKSAMVEIQADEYGGGRTQRMHSELFRKTMRSLDLDDSYGGYVNQTPAISLASANLVSLFGLHRKHRFALVGHFAGVEMTSSFPSRKYANGLRRVGASPDATDFFDEHVEADAIHEQLVVRGACLNLATQDLGAIPEIVFGVACYLHMEKQFAEMLLAAWTDNGSSLRDDARQHVSRSRSQADLSNVPVVHS
jgi:hypothetical protein